MTRRLPKGWRKHQITSNPDHHQGDIDIAAQTRDWSWLEARALERLTKSRERMGVYTATDQPARSAPDEPPA